MNDPDIDGVGLPVEGRALHEARRPDLNPDTRLPGEYGFDVDAEAEATAQKLPCETPADPDGAVDADKRIP